MSLPGHCFALIPVRDFATGKSRLAPALDAPARVRLGRWMLERVLSAVGAARGVSEIAVLSDSAEVLSLARARGARELFRKSAGLNEDLEVGRAWARDEKADALLVIHGDLPFLTAEEVNAFLEEGPSPPREVRIARSGDGGTNALLIRPPGAIPFLFGCGSFRRHLEAARHSGCDARVCESFGLARDIDSPADLELLLAREPEAPVRLASAPAR